MFDTAGPLNFHHVLSQARHRHLHTTGRLFSKQQLALLRLLGLFFSTFMSPGVNRKLTIGHGCTYAVFFGARAWHTTKMHQTQLSTLVRYLFGKNCMYKDEATWDQLDLKTLGHFVRVHILRAVTLNYSPGPTACASEDVYWLRVCALFQKINVHTRDHTSYDTEATPLPASALFCADSCLWQHVCLPSDVKPSDVRRCARVTITIILLKFHAAVGTLSTQERIWRALDSRC